MPSGCRRHLVIEHDPLGARAPDGFAQALAVWALFPRSSTVASCVSRCRWFRPTKLEQSTVRPQRRAMARTVFHFLASARHGSIMTAPNVVYALVSSRSRNRRRHNFGGRTSARRLAVPVISHLSLKPLMCESPLEADCYESMQERLNPETAAQPRRDAPQRLGELLPTGLGALQGQEFRSTRAQEFWGEASAILRRACVARSYFISGFVDSYFGRTISYCFWSPKITPSDLCGRGRCGVRASCASMPRRRVAAPIGEYVRPRACPSAWTQMLKSGRKMLGVLSS